MQKLPELIRKIEKGIDENWLDAIEEYGVAHIFLPVYNSSINIQDKNRVVCYIHYAYNPDSLWLDFRKDRIELKQRILQNLKADIKSDFYKNLIAQKSESANISIFNFLEALKDWRFRMIYDYLEYAANMSRFAGIQTEEERRFERLDKKSGQVQKLSEEVNITDLTKVNKEKGILLDQSLDARRKADELLREIRKDFVATDQAVQSDFGFTYTETAKKRNILSWREWIKEREAI